MEVQQAWMLGVVEDRIQTNIKIKINFNSGVHYLGRWWMLLE